jgi:hypothetical protein
MRHFEHESRVSCEGGIAVLTLAALPGASTSESLVLRRATLAPELEFVVVPVTIQTMSALRAISASGKFDELIHVQIEHAGQLVLGAYDNFHRDCVVAYEPTPESLLEDLKVRGVIRSYSVADEPVSE